MKKNTKKTHRDLDTARGNAVLVCPPDRAGKSFAVRFFGIFFRYVIVSFAVFGLMLLIDDSIRTEMGGKYLFCICFAVCAFLSLLFCSKWTALGAGICGAAFLTVKVLLDSAFIRRTLYGCIAVYNAFIQRLVDRNFLTMSRFFIDVGPSASGAEYSHGFVPLTILIALAFVPFAIKRTRLIFPAILSTAILVVICTYNLSDSNWAIAFIIAAFGALLVVNRFDKYYIKEPETKHNSAELQLFGDTDRPSLPDIYVEQEKTEKEKEIERKKQKEEKLELRKRKKEQTLTVDEEISDYFSSSKDKKKHKKDRLEKSDKSAKKKDKKAQIDEKKKRKAAVRKVKRYDRITLDAKSAMGGFTGIVAFLLLFSIVLGPAVLTDSNFTAVPAITDKLSFYRAYLTAFLQGDDVVLDDLEYARNASNFAPRNTDAKKREFLEIPVMKIDTSYPTDVYLTGWIATEYRDGAWYTANYNGEDYNNYRGLYSAVYDRTSTPYENVFFNFMNTYIPYDMHTVDFEDDNVYINSAHGVLAEQVNIKRLANIGTQLYLPSRFSIDYKLRKHGSYEELEENYVNFYDGIYTGKAFGEIGAEYAAVSYMMIQKNANWINNLSDYIAEFNVAYDKLCKEILNPRREKIKRYSEENYTKKLIMEELYKEVDIGYNSAGGITVFVPEGYVGAGTYWIYTTNKDKYGNLTVYCSETGVTYTISEEGEISRTPAQNTHNLPFAVRYLALMSEADRMDVASMFYDYYIYSNFVHDTYTDTADSDIVSKYYQDILAAMSDEEYTSMTTDGNGNYAMPNAENSTLASSHENRHKLVMKIIDTLAAEGSGYTYTLEPQKKLDSKLDGVENFLTVTKEGYCVQFASAAALLLREAGIPVRYVEGYLASDIVKRISVKDGFGYYSVVKDSDAHAWIEVWYDGIGWVSYETTPKFYNDAYGIIPDDVEDPDDTLPEDTTSAPDDTDEEEPLDTEESSDLPLDTEIPTDDIGGDDENGIVTTVCIIAAVLVCLSGAVFGIVFIVKCAEKHRREKEKLLSSAESGSFTEDERHGVARRLIDMTMELLRVFGTPPGKSEPRTDYAKRLEKEYLNVFRKRKHVNVASLSEEEIAKLDGNDYYIVCDTDIVAIFDSIAAEEFGLSGMTREQIHDLAVFYKRLYTAMPARLSSFEIFKYRYFKFI